MRRLCSDCKHLGMKHDANYYLQWTCNDGKKPIGWHVHTHFHNLDCFEHRNPDDDQCIDCSSAKDCEYFQGTPDCVIQLQIALKIKGVFLKMIIEEYIDYMYEKEGWNDNDE